MTTAEQRSRAVSGARDELVLARQVADAVLYEGYILFPYRASAPKNRFRWQWGVVVPEQQRAAGHAEPSEVVCQVLVRHPAGSDVPTLAATARFLTLRHRQMVDAGGTPVDRLDAGDAPTPTWDEGVEREVAVRPLVLDGPGGTAAHSLAFDVLREEEAHGDVGSAVRTHQALSGEIRTSWEPLASDVSLVTVTVANTTPWVEPGADRDEVLRRAFVGVHVLLQATGGVTIASVIDPPGWADEHADRRRSRTLHPVLAGGPVHDHDGEARAGTIALALPIILGDFPEVAPESAGQSFDATEVDELLALCVLGLSDEEKAEARATDPRAAELIDRTTTLPPAVMERLHGTVRSMSGPAGLLPEPEVHITPETAAALGVGEAPLDRVRVGGTDVVVGSRVRLRPRRRADAQDLFLDGRVGLVERIVATDDDQAYVAVTVEDDPAADLHRWYGRFHYFGSDEIEPVTAPRQRHADDQDGGDHGR